MYYVYVLINEEGKAYYGFTRDLRRRARQHQEGLNRSTRGKRWRLSYYEAYLDESDARRREKALKQSSQGRRWLKERAKRSIELCRKS